MPLQSNPTFSASPFKTLQIKKPGIGGLNLKDLEFEQNVNQSPYMLNMMYRNGAFSKRYGQEYDKTYDETIYNMEVFNGKFMAHIGNKMYFDDVDCGLTLPETKGMFMKFYQALYYMVDRKIYEYSKEDGEFSWSEMEPYIPDLFYSAEPQKIDEKAESGESGYGGDLADGYNILSTKAKEYYNGDGTTKVYYIKGLKEYYVWDKATTKIMVDNGQGEQEVTDYTMDENEGTITFGVAPSDRGNNVEITWTLKETAMKQDRDRLLNSKYAISFGGSNSTRLFMAGGGDSKYFFSESFDASFFPESNWAIIGRTEQDITGFGLQYNVLMIFKPDEIYQLRSTTQNAYDAQGNLVSKEIFDNICANSQIGCDCPYTIQLIDNKLTWLSSRYGICTIVSSNIIDERNVRQISRNIDRTNNFGVKGILDYNEDKNKIQSIDFDNKYFIVMPESGMCFMWDYSISPYYYTSSKETDTKILDFFLFDNFYADKFIQKEKDLFYIKGNQLVKLNNKYNDFGEAIHSYYMTPYFLYDANDYLKTVKNMYVQCRGDIATKIDITYYTEEEPNGIPESESIVINSKLWRSFAYNTFAYDVLNVANTFRRKCALKKIQLMAVKFENNDVDCDMSITYIGLEYQNVKRVK